jgi:hypothetical protein
MDSEMNQGFQHWAPLTALVRGIPIKRRHLTAALIIGKGHMDEPLVSQAQTMATPDYLKRFKASYHCCQQF